MYEIANHKFFINDPELGLELSGTLGEPHRIFYESGALKWEAFYLGEKFHGPSTFFSPEGIVLSKSWFFEGIRQGKVLQYYSSSKLYAGLRYQHGLLEGQQVYYYEDGQLKTEMFYKKGVLHGRTLLFWPNGTLKRESHFEEGKKGLDQLFDENKNLIKEMRC
jgi:antitoxin component YwqK of YwqJK toxin-antitoxin module